MTLDEKIIQVVYKHLKNETTRICMKNMIDDAFENVISQYHTSPIEELEETILRDVEMFVIDTVYEKIIN